MRGGGWQDAGSVVGWSKKQRSPFRRGSGGRYCSVFFAGAGFDVEVMGLGGEGLYGVLFWQFLCCSCGWVVLGLLYGICYDVRSFRLVM